MKVGDRVKLRVPRVLYMYPSLDKLHLPAGAVVQVIEVWVNKGCCVHARGYQTWIKQSEVRFIPHLEQLAMEAE